MALNDNTDLLNLLRNRDPFLYRKFPFMYSNPWGSYSTGYGGDFPSMGLDMGAGMPFGGSLTGGQFSIYPDAGNSGYGGMANPLGVNPSEAEPPPSTLPGTAAQDPNWARTMAWGLGLPGGKAPEGYRTSKPVGTGLNLISRLLTMVTGVPLPLMTGVKNFGVGLYNQLSPNPVDYPSTGPFDINKQAYVPGPFSPTAEPTIDPEIIQAVIDSVLAEPIGGASEKSGGGGTGDLGGPSAGGGGGW